jgi:hypothetical protein
MLLLSLGLLIVVFCLTFWQQAGNIKRWYDGVPRLVIRTSVADGRNEAGQPKNLRNLRIAAFALIIIGSLLSFLVYFLRPKHGIRVGLCFFYALLLFAGGVIAWVAFGIGIAKHQAAVRYSDNYRRTWAQPINRMAYAITAIALDAGMGFFGILAAILLAYNAKAGHWKLAARNFEDEQRDRESEPVKQRIPGEMIHKNVSFVRKWIVALALLAALAIAAASVVFVVILASDDDREYVRNVWGRSNQWNDRQLPYEMAGWPRTNTGLRYAGTAIGILAILFNFMPFQSKTIAIIFAFFYFTSATLLLVAFGFDVNKLRRVDDLDCPRAIDGESTRCYKNMFTTTAVIEFITVVVLLLYIIVEYCYLGAKNNKTLYIEDEIVVQQQQFPVFVDQPQYPVFVQ